MTCRPAIAGALILGFVFVLGPSAAVASGEAAPASKPEQQSMEKAMTRHPYVGMWATDGGHIRHELLPNGRYDEARGTRKSAYQGRYEIKGDHIDYWDDTGFTADGRFVDKDTLHHGGMIFRRQ
ncbi:Atu4866 domain-containing protein [Bradyrhizobium sp. 157]|uniref:Atu4866 domain-containing protein n=1 Tax=Bradyrhizobium sp. 157 TaxID=2782631 RepID=UPI001FFA6016|nr:Atu4866 domain-containing protein [Bradyrhizobium sp. 157]MCK1639395.1 Atu4866 domain-containing protein [Bradyrhizobium sp. 157]